MNKLFQPIKLLQTAAHEGKTGHLQITANQVTWDFYLVEGMLQDATHSLQSLATVQHYLLFRNQTAIAKMLPSLAQKVPPTHSVIFGIFKQLNEQNSLPTHDLFMLATDLIKDALESYLWLKEGDYRWYDYEQTQSSDNLKIKEDDLLAISTLLDTFSLRMKAWKILSHVITSPHQRLLCTNPSLIEKKVPSGTLNPTTLGQLVQVMQGKTLRQSSLFLKQDELKVAQLLLPYFKNNILELQPPKPPLDKLPLISPITPTSPPPKRIVRQQPSVKKNDLPSPQTTEKKPLKIVCIDDSPSILDMVKAYLSGDQFEVFTVDNPTQSLPCLFECKPDLILIDFSMPGINGNKLCRIIKGSSFFKNTPIIMISGNEKMLTPENIQAAGATDYLAKPFTKELLRRLINKYLLTNTNTNQPLTNTNTNTNQSLTNTITNMNQPSNMTEKAKISISNNSIRKPINIIQTYQDIDPLTRLPNRQCFEQYLSVVTRDFETTQSPFSLMFITIDNLTDIQDILGQKEGDKIVQNMAKHIKSFVRANDIVARWTDSEFVILLKSVNNAKLLDKISERIINTVKPTPLLSEYELTLKLSHTIKIHSLEKVV